VKRKQPYQEGGLTQAVSTSEQEAYTKLYTQYHSLLFQYALQFLKSKPLAEDVCHEVFMNLWQHRHELSKIESVKAYLITSTRNTSINALKSISRSQQKMADVCRSFPQQSFNTQELLLHKEYVAFVHKEIENLPGRAKEVFSLCRDEGYSYEQVSRQLGISRNAVKGHMVNSMKKLRSLVAKKLDISFVLSLLYFVGR
jgi:RNA polymerase sigma-70 factor (ECF subfamily)